MECRAERDLKSTSFTGAFSWQSSFRWRKWTDLNANFHTMINLRYEIVGTALLPWGCALLLYSISQLLPAITVDPHHPPHTKPLLLYIYQPLYKRWKHMTAALWAPFPPGLGGLCWGRGPPAGPQCICSVGWAAVTPRGPLIFPLRPGRTNILVTQGFYKVNRGF